MDLNAKLSDIVKLGDDLRRERESRFRLQQRIRVLRHAKFTSTPVDNVALDSAKGELAQCESREKTLAEELRTARALIDRAR